MNRESAKMFHVFFTVQTALPYRLFSSPQKYTGYETISRRFFCLPCSKSATHATFTRFPDLKLADFRESFELQIVLRRKLKGLS